MDKILSFGAGVQTTALAILANQGKVKYDVAIFADTGGEKSETYWYMDNYIEELFHEVNIPFIRIRNELPSCQPDLYGWLFKHQQIPSVSGFRLCSIKFKRETIERYCKGREYKTLLGFSTDEASRAKPNQYKRLAEYPLIEKGLSGNYFVTILLCFQI